MLITFLRRIQTMTNANCSMFKCRPLISREAARTQLMPSSRLRSITFQLLQIVAQSLVVGFQNILSNARRHSKKIICLITDGFSNGEDPSPIAENLKEDNVTIITFGIQSGNSAELIRLSSEPGNEHSFLLDSFTQFESLARKALHTGIRATKLIKTN